VRGSALRWTFRTKLRIRGDVKAVVGILVDVTFGGHDEDIAEYEAGN
jgi:hypothetical protein